MEASHLGAEAPPVPDCWWDACLLHGCWSREDYQKHSGTQGQERPGLLPSPFCFPAGNKGRPHRTGRNTSLCVTFVTRKLMLPLWARQYLLRRAGALLRCEGWWPFTPLSPVLIQMPITLGLAMPAYTPACEFQWSLTSSSPQQQALLSPWKGHLTDYFV